MPNYRHNNGDRKLIIQYVSPKELIEDTKINHLNLRSSMMDQASLFSRYVALSYDAQVQESNAKMVYETAQAKADIDIRRKAAAENKRITEKEIERFVTVDESVIKALDEYNEAKAVAKLATNALSALSQKKDMLVSVANDERAEKRSIGTTVTS